MKNFENYLRNNNGKMLFVNRLEVITNAGKSYPNSYVHTLEAGNKIQGEDNLVTIAGGFGEVSIWFEDGFSLQEMFRFIDGSLGNGATPNGNYMAKKHITHGLNNHPIFGETSELDEKSKKWKPALGQPSFWLYENNIVKTKPKKSGYKNRTALLIHGSGSEETRFNAVDAITGESFTKIGVETEGCIGIVGNNYMRRFLPFFASHINIHNSFAVTVNFEGNVNVGYQIYKR